MAKLERSPELCVLLAMLDAFPEDRIDRLEHAATSLLARDPEGESAQIGHALVKQAVAIRRAKFLLAGLEG